MKKFVFCLFIILTLALSCFAPLNLKAYAYSNYYQTNNTAQLMKRVVNDTTPFYIDSQGNSLLFYLPCSYYVKVLESDQLFTHVECFDGQLSPTLDGYVPTNMLHDENSFISLPYLELTITTAKPCSLYLNTELEDNIQLIFANRTLGYYGKIQKDDQTLYFVCYNNKLGYVKEEDVMPFSVPYHANPLPTKEPLPQQTTVSKNTSTDILKTSIIVCLLLAGLIAIFFSLRKNTLNAKSTIAFDDTDYENF